MFRKLLYFVVGFALLVGAVALLVNRAKDVVADKALQEIGVLLDRKTGDLIVGQRTIADSLRQAETRNTQRSAALQDELDRLSRQNRALQNELAQVRGEVTAVATSVSEIALAAGDTVHVGSGDFAHHYQDAWIEANIERRGERLLFDYATTFRLEEFDVEVTLADGVKTHLFNTALVSTATGDTLHVPTKRHVIERRPSGRRFLWNPQTHLQAAGGLDSIWGGVGVSAFSYGDAPIIEATDFYLLQAALLIHKGGASVAVGPGSWNLGRIVSFLDNLTLGPAWAWSEDQSGVVLLVGAAL